MTCCLIRCTKKEFPWYYASITVEDDGRNEETSQSKQQGGIDGPLRLLAVNCKKKVTFKRVPSFENASVPSNIFTEHGVLVSCVKSDFMHKVEEVAADQTSVEIDARGAAIFDGHAVIQKISLPDNSIH